MELRKIYMIAELAFVVFAAFMLYYAYGILGLSESKTSFVDVAIYILSIGVLVLVINLLAWLGSEENDGEGALSSGALVLFGHSAVFGTAVLILYLQFSGDYESLNIAKLTSEQMMIIEAIAVANLIGLIISFVTIRNGDVMSEMGWYIDQVKSKTAIWKIILSMMLPLLILLAVIYIIGKMLGGTAIETMEDTSWYCPNCHRSVPDGKDCPKCGYHQYDANHLHQN